MSCTIVDLDVYRNTGEIVAFENSILQKKEAEFNKEEFGGLDNIAMAMEMSTDELINYLSLRNNLEASIRYIPIDIVINELVNRIAYIEESIQETIREIGKY